MESKFDQAQSEFGQLMLHLESIMPGKIQMIGITGDHIYSHKEDRFWFHHVLYYSDCETDCQGHEYWGCYVDHLKAFDALAGTPDLMQGYRVVHDLKEALDGSWADGGVYNRV